MSVSGESRSLFLALDQGGTSSRAVVFDALGRQVAAAHVPIATQRWADGRVEHSAEELLRSLQTAVRDACETPQVQGRPLLAAGLATQRSSICCWDRTDGRPLSSVLSWQDRRNAAWLVKELGERATWVRELTGLPLSPHYGASKLRWCLDELPAVRLALRDRRLTAGPIASFLSQRLCSSSEASVDPANASRTLLFDPALLDWSPPLLDAFEIPRGILPRCVGTAHDYGALSLADGRCVPLRACSGDQSAAVFAFGPPETTTAYVNAGTGVFVQRPVREGSAPTPPGLLKSVLFAQADAACGALHAHEGTVNGGHAALEWLASRLDSDVWRSLETLSATPDFDDVPLLFMNGVGGLGAPYWLPEFATEFVQWPAGEIASIDRATDLQRVAAVIESIAFLVAVNVRAMQRSAPLHRMVITGGLAACDYLCQVLAAVSGMRVERPELVEATARGIAFLAAGQPQSWLPVAIARTFEPNDQHGARERFKHWQLAMAARGAH